MAYSRFDSRESDGIGDESQAAWNSNSQPITLVCNKKHISYPLWKASLPPHSSIFRGRLLRVFQFLFWGGFALLLLNVMMVDLSLLYCHQSVYVQIKEYFQNYFFSKNELKKMTITFFITFWWIYAHILVKSETIFSASKADKLIFIY